MSSVSPTPASPEADAPDGREAREFAQAIVDDERWHVSGHDAIADTDRLVGFISEAILAAERHGAERERGRCISDAEGEKLSGETDDEGDRIYDRAIDDVIHAIRARGERP